MASQIDIINLALRRLGNSTIQSLTEGSKAANVMSDIYNILLENETRSWPYTWATTTQALAEIEGEDPPDFAYVFQLPATYLQIVKIINTGTSSIIDSYEPWYGINWRNQSQWEIREDKLYTNASTIAIKYIFRQDDTTKWDPNFVEAFAWKLAQEGAVPISGRDDQSANAFQQYQLAVSKARTSNGAEARRRTAVSRDYLNARH